MNVRTKVLLVVLMLPITASCGESITSAQAQSAELAQIQQQLATVIERLESIEESQAEQLEEIDEKLGVLGTTVNQLSVNVGASAGASAAVEGSICAKSSLAGKAELKTLFSVRGQADGMLGVDAYGNGANATLRAYLSQKANANVNPSASLEMQLCGKLSGQTGVQGGVSIDASDPVIALLEELMGSVGTSELVSAASNVNMTGARTGQAVSTLSNLSASGLSSAFNGGGGSSFTDALPIPSDIRSVIDNPTSLLSEAGNVAGESVDLLCDPSLRVGEFATLMSSGCDLRDQMPPPEEVVDVISNLNSFQSSLGTLESSFASLETSVGNICTTVGNVTGQRLVIPSRSITIVNTSYTTFPGYNEPLFPGIGSPNC